MRGKRRPWLLGLALGLSLASPAVARSLSHDGGACGATSITESATQNIISGNSIACSDPMTGFTLETHYWRAFDLPTFGINGGFDVCQVQIAVEAALSVAGSQPLSVYLFSTTVGTFPAGTLTPIGSASLTVPDQDQTFLTVPITGSVPPNSALVVEVASPDGTGDLFAFFIGSNADGQTAPSYLSAPNCGIAAPTDLAVLGHPEMQIVMTVRGTEAPISPAALDVDSAGNGVLEIGEPVLVAPSWHNAGTTAVALTGSSSNFTGPAGPAYDNPDTSGDYGTIGMGATAQCANPCYAVQITAVSRPVQHWDATLDETVVATLGGGTPSKTWTLHVGGSFGDVSTDIGTDPYYPSIETVFHNGVTAGCQDGTVFCPNDPTTRAQMAVFLLKGLLGAVYVPPACAGIFTDVPCPATPGFPFSDYVEDLYGRGITSGCSVSPLMYCPDNNVLRSQMAVFLLKASQGSGYTPPACAGIFTDVPCPATPEFPFSDFVEDLYGRGITSGCSVTPLMYCPDNNVLRQEMAVFLTKTFGLVLYGP